MEPPPPQVLLDITNRKRKQVLEFDDISPCQTPIFVPPECLFPDTSKKLSSKKKASRIRETKTFVFREFLVFIYSYILDFYGYSVLDYPFERFLEVVESKGISRRFQHLIHFQRLL